MAQFYIVNESTEDMVEAGENLQDAIRLAKKMTGDGPAGGPVSILDSGGLAIKQFVRMPDRTVAEQAVPLVASRPGNDSKGDRAEASNPASGPRDARSIAS